MGWLDFKNRSSLYIFSWAKITNALIYAIKLVNFLQRDPLADHSQDQIHQRVNGVIMLFHAKAQEGVRSCSHSCRGNFTILILMYRAPRATVRAYP